MGEIFALSTAVVWAGAVIFFKRSGETVSPFGLNLFRVVVSSALLVATLGVTGQPLLGVAPASDYLILIFSGLIAIAAADTLFHKSLNMVGAGITAIIDSLYPVFVVVLAYALLGERMGPWQYGGIAMVLGGLFVAGGHAPPPDTPRRTMVIGVLWGAAGMFLLSFGVVIAKPVLERTPVLWATTVRQLACLVVMIPYALLSSRRRIYLDVFRPRRDWRFTLPGTVLGSYLALILWLAGMKYTQAGVAAVLNQTSTIYVMIFATLFLRESFTRRKLLAASLAIGGILMVTTG